MRKHKRTSDDNVHLIKLHSVQVHLNAYLFCRDPEKFEKQLNKLLRKYGAVRVKGGISLSHSPYAIPRNKRQAEIIRRKANEARFASRVNHVMANIIADVAEVKRKRLVNNPPPTRRSRARDTEVLA